MARHPLWNEEYWLLLLQLYQKKPMGVKPLYSKGMVDLSLELHIPPEFLHEQMFKLRMVTPRIKRLWEKYADKPQKLKRDIQRIRQMNGCGNAIQFFEGVEVKETFEKNWEPLESEPSLTPVKLIIILDLYFQLTPITMVPETPEIIDLGNSSDITEGHCRGDGRIHVLRPLSQPRRRADTPAARSMQRHLAPIRKRKSRQALPACQRTKRIL